MKVLQFAFGGDAGQSATCRTTTCEHCVVYTGTHDNDTTLRLVAALADGDARPGCDRYLGRRRPHAAGT